MCRVGHHITNQRSSRHRQISINFTQLIWPATFWSQGSHDRIKTKPSLSCMTPGENTWGNLSVGDKEHPMEIRVGIVDLCSAPNSPKSIWIGCAGTAQIAPDRKVECRDVIETFWKVHFMRLSYVVCTIATVIFTKSQTWCFRQGDVGWMDFVVICKRRGSISAIFSS